MSDNRPIRPQLIDWGRIEFTRQLLGVLISPAYLNPNNPETKATDSVLSRIGKLRMILLSSLSSVPVVTQSHRRRQAFCWYRQRQAVVKKRQTALCCLGVEEEVDYQVVSAINTSYNDILILDTAQSRLLLLDSTHNVHSIFMKGQPWTGSYWDEFASLPAIVPEGPIAIFGLGGGTAAHLMLTLWPSLHLHGWEIDEILIDKAREHLGLSDIEKHTQGGGVLIVHIGDALSTSTTGYAGIVIDLFSGGEVLPQLQEVETWLQLNDKLMPNGRLMVNCGGSTSVTGSTDWEKNNTLVTLCKAFPGQVNWKKMGKSEGENYLALTGPLPDFTLWASALPDRLGSSVVQWASCFP